MGCLKRMLRKSHKPLEQIIKRYNEICSLKSNTKIINRAPYFSGLHNHGPIMSSSIKGKQFTTLILKNMTIKTHMERVLSRYLYSYFLTQDKKIVKILNIIMNENSDVILICKIFDQKYELFMKPIKSSELDIYVVKNLSENFHTFNIKDIEKKMILLPSSNNILIVLPIIHSTLNI
jgi:hypothetical protein